MKITSGTQLLANIDAGKHFGFDEQGQVKTFNIWNRFIQSVGDFFGRSREQIEERNTRLQNTMTDMLRKNNAFPNLTDSIGASLPLDAAIQNAMIARMEMVDQLKSFPSAIRPDIREMVMEQLRDNGTMDAIDPSVVRTAVKACVRGLSMTPQVVAKAAMANLPPPSVDPFFQPDLREAVMTLLHENGTLNEHDPSVVRAAVKAHVKELSESLLKDVPPAARLAMKDVITDLCFKNKYKHKDKDNVFLTTYRFTKKLVEEFSTPAMLAFFSRVKHVPTPLEQKVMTQIMHKTLLESLKQENIAANGLHESFGKDAEESPITIDGKDTTEDNAEQELIDAIPKKFLPFVSTVLSESGMPYCIERYKDNKEWDTTKYPARNFNTMLIGIDDIVTEDFRLPPLNELKTDKIDSFTFHHKTELHTNLADDFIIKQSNVVRFMHKEDGTDICTHHYDITLTIPKDQKEEDFSSPMLPKHTMKVEMRVVDPALQNKDRDAK